MILTIPLLPGTALANVRYRWIVGGVEQAELSSGVTQPDINFPFFVFTVTPPTNADEIIAYELGNLSNWNVGQYKLGLIGTAPSFPVTLVQPTFAPLGLRTVTFKSVYRAIMRRHGLNPLADAVTHDTLRAIVEHINDRVNTAWNYWEWPQLQLMQQRAFRTRWTNTLQFLKVNAQGVPDELYYTTTDKYYQVKSTAPTDPPAGTAPTNTTYFQELTMVNRYISLDQVNETPIGEVISVFDTDPKADANRFSAKIPFRATDQEITMTYAGTSNLVWVVFKIVPSEFTGVPFVTGKTYTLGEAVFNPADGECYRALIAGPTGDPTAQPTQWLKVPFPKIFAKYVRAGAYADGLRETDVAENDPVKLQVRNTKMQLIDGEAESYLQQEVDRLIREGQVYRYGQYSPVNWWN